VDLVSKAGHVRTVPVPDWVKRELDGWLAAAAVDRGKVFRRVTKVGRTWGDGMTEKSVWHIVKEAAKNIGLAKVSPHDLRRYAESDTMPSRDSETLRKQRESCGFSVVLLGSMRHSPVCFTGHGGSSALAIRSSNDLPLPPVSVGAPANCLGRLVSRVVKNDRRFLSLANPLMDLFGISIFALAPDYAESLRCGKPQAAAMARSFGIFRNSA
jgi:hypothetical protein